MADPVFYYDLSSPYAYLAAERINSVLGERVRWQPIAFGALLRQISKLPWSMRAEERPAGIADVEQRAADRGLPPVRWPEGWPDRSYSLAAPRAALLASEPDERMAVSLALFRAAFVDGDVLSPERVVEAASAAGMDTDRVLTGLSDDAIKQALREATDAAVARGVTGIPTVAVGEALFWGDDRLEEAAAALA